MQDCARPAVGRDVVHDVEEHVVVRRPSRISERAQQRSAREVELVLGLVAEDRGAARLALLLGGRRAQVDALELDRSGAAR